LRKSEALGFSVSLSDEGTVLAVGSLDGTERGTGLVRVFMYAATADNWIQLGLDIEGPSTDDLFGMSVSLSGNGTTLAVGAPL